MPLREPTIGELRWPVVIANRLQQQDLNGPGIVESLFRVQAVHARIVSVGKLTFYGAEQVDTPVSHEIVVRWLNYPDTTHVVLRQTFLPDGTIRCETFRIRRIAEYEGRKRWLFIEADLERFV